MHAADFDMFTAVHYGLQAVQVQHDQSAAAGQAGI
jgi:hypothetical protein